MVQAVIPNTFPQTVPAATWTISHGYGRNPSVSVKVIYNGVLTEILPKSITFPDTATVVIEFSTAFSGEARLA